MLSADTVKQAPLLSPCQVDQRDLPNTSTVCTETAITVPFPRLRKFWCCFQRSYDLQEYCERAQMCENQARQDLERSEKSLAEERELRNQLCSKLRSLEKSEEECIQLAHQHMAEEVLQLQQHVGIPAQDHKCFQQEVRMHTAEETLQLQQTVEILAQDNGRLQQEMCGLEAIGDHRLEEECAFRREEDVLRRNLFCIEATETKCELSLQNLLAERAADRDENAYVTARLEEDYCLQAAHAELEEVIMCEEIQERFMIESAKFHRWQEKFESLCNEPWARTEHVNISEPRHRSEETFENNMETNKQAFEQTWSHFQRTLCGFEAAVAADHMMLRRRCEEACMPARKQQECQVSSYAEHIQQHSDSSMVFPQSTYSENEQDADQGCRSGSWIDAKDFVSDFNEYVNNFCGAFKIDIARRLVEFGEALLESFLCGNDALFDPILKKDVQRATSAVVWALMHKALQRGQGFEEGTFVVYGPDTERILMTLLPYLKGRPSSHFKGRVVAPDAENFSDGTNGWKHFGINVDPDGSNNLPAQNRHVLLGLIRMHDDSRGLYIKPEKKGCDTSSSEHLGETLQHGFDWGVSQVRRRLGDRRAHDEGELKRKEYLPTEDEKWYDEHIETLKAIVKDEAPPVSEFGLGQMVKTLDRQLDCLSKIQINIEEKRQHWMCLHGSSLQFRTGREVLIHTSDLLGRMTAPTSSVVGGLKPCNEP